MGDRDSNRDPSLVPPLRDRELRFANWVFTLSVSASDGYRIQTGEITIRDGWSEHDSTGCVETLGITAAGLIKAVEASGIAVYGGDAVQGFREGYRDEEPSDPASVPHPKVSGA